MADVLETIGNGAVISVDDGGSNAYVAVDNLISFEVPNEKLGTVQSKRLTLPSSRLIRLPTIFDPGMTTVQQDFGHNGWSRMEGLRSNKTKKNWKFIIPDDTGVSGTTIIVAGYVTSNKVTKIEADKITEFETTVEFTGVQS